MKLISLYSSTVPTLRKTLLVQNKDGTVGVVQGVDCLCIRSAVQSSSSVPPPQSIGMHAVCVVTAAVVHVLDRLAHSITFLTGM